MMNRDVGDGIGVILLLMLGWPIILAAGFAVWVWVT